MTQAGVVEDWQSRKTFQECNRYMLENEICCDVTFLLGENRKRISAHKYVLISRSFVFQAMFCGPVAEREGEIAIPDIPEEAFTVMLRYLYCEEVQLTPEGALSVFYAAKKYGVGALEDYILSWLSDNITGETVCTILNEAVLFSENSLKNECLKFIDNHASTVLSSSSFADLTKGSLVNILERDSLVINEEKVWDAVLEWACAECGRQDVILNGASQREVLGEVLYLVRLPLLSDKYFTEKVEVLDILTEEERTLLIRERTGDKVSVSGCDSRFTSKPRSKPTSKALHLTMQTALQERHAKRSTRREVSDYVRLIREQKSSSEDPLKDN